MKSQENFDFERIYLCLRVCDHHTMMKREKEKSKTDLHRELYGKQCLLSTERAAAGYLDSQVSWASTLPS